MDKAILYLGSFFETEGWILALGGAGEAGIFKLL